LSENGNKICNTCKQHCSKCNIELTEDNQDSSSLFLRKNYVCKSCVAQTVRNTVNKEARRDYDLLKNYGITNLDYENLLKLQSNCCDICKINIYDYKKRFHVDHNHKTGKVRSLLCSSCNTGLGKFKENIDFLEQAINYLKRHNETIIS
jgi:hypothetical protein